MKNIKFKALFFTSLVVFGCSDASYYESKGSATYKNDAAVASAEYAGADSFSESAVSEDMMSSSVAKDTHVMTADGQKRQLIKKADASFHVKDVYKAALTLEDMTKQYGGFVTQNRIDNVNSRTHTQKTDNGVQTVVAEFRPEAQLTLRVPQEKLQPFLREMVKHVEFIYSRYFSAEDVLLEITKQQQLAKVNAAATRRVSNAEQKGDKLGEKVSAIDSKVLYQEAKILADIEKAELADKVAFSTLSLHLIQSPLVRTYTENHFAYAVEKVRPSFWYRIEESLEAGWEHFLSFLVGLASLWPFILFFPFVYAVCKWGRKKWKARRLKKASKG